MRRGRNAGWLVIFGLLALLVILALVGEGKPDLTEPREDLCPQGAALRQARLWERAQDLYLGAAAEGDACAPGGGGSRAPLRETEAQIARAERLVLIATASSSAKRYKIATRSYVEALSVYPFNGAARLGLAEVLGNPETEASLTPASYCALGSELIKAGVLGQAQATIQAGLKDEAASGGPLRHASQDASPLVCRKKLRALSARSAAAVAALNAATKSASEGEVAKARERYATALTANAELTEARTELEASIDEESHLDAIGSWLEGVPATLKTALRWLVPLAVGLLLLAILVWIVVREGSARIIWMRRLFEWIGKRSAFFHDAAVPEISIEPFEGSDSTEAQGKELTNLLSAAMAEESRRGGSFPFDRLNKGTTEDSAFTSVVSEALSETSETKLLGELIKVLSRLFRRRSVILRGRLISAGDQGVGLLLMVEGNGREISAEETLWEKTFDPQPEGEEAVRYLRLVAAAKVWARQQLGAAYELPREAKTGDWLPDALFQSALPWQARRDFERAEALYVLALEKEPDLLPAAHNLATIEMHCQEFPAAEARLRRLRERLSSLREERAEAAGGKGGAGKAKLWPVLGTASLYSLILAIVYPEIKTNAGPNPRLREAVDLSEQLVRKLSRLMEPPRNEFLSEENIHELEAAELPSVVLRASLLLRQFPRKRAQAVAEAFQPGRQPPIGRRDLVNTLSQLEPWHLIDYVQSRKVISRRTHYNLACYYTTLGTYAGDDRDRCFELALRELKTSLVGGELGQWAALDPALTPLRRAKQTEFAGALKAHEIEKIAKQDDGDGKDEDKGKEAKPLEVTCKQKAAKGGIVGWLGERLQKFGERLANSGANP